MKSIQEEADVIIIPYQVLEAIADGKIILKSTAKAQMFPFGFATVTAEELENIYMTHYTERKNIISIKDTVKTHKVLIPELLYIHAKLGCGTAPI